MLLLRDTEDQNQIMVTKFTSRIGALKGDIVSILHQTTQMQTGTVDLTPSWLVIQHFLQV